MNGTEGQPLDLFVVGGGINGAGIACDAAGRTLTVGLCEMNDFASATSSASTKLIHGGLRYLEHYEFRLVREALMEREVLLAKAPHLSWPLRFVLPHEPHLRPRWMLRLGLFLYDHLDWHMTLPKSKAVDLQHSKFGAGLKSTFRKGFVYSDGWVDDARMVIANLKSARNMGARIFARHRCTSARRTPDGKLWDIELAAPQGTTIRLQARGLVNASGPWVKHFLDEQAAVRTPKRVRLVKGSHIVVPRLHDGDHAFILQNEDNRIVFVIPYERDFSLIGTTDITVETSDKPVCSPEEIAYLCDIAGHYMAKPVTPADVVWTYSGVRPLFDDGDDDPSAVTRDYHLEVDAPEGGGAPILSVFGGKITTYRRLAEHALEDLRPFYPSMGNAWTAHKALADGEMADAPSFEQAFDRFVEGACAAKPGLPRDLVRVLARRHGTGLDDLLDEVRTVADLGRCFGGHLYEAEVRYLMREEWAAEPDDVLWRRTKEGLHMSVAQRTAFAQWMSAQRPNT
ncbi:glycerol-3-phosphate dehydrogenase [Enhydrobacter aerosaccus]|uniref:Glycerol-3-phosphate dehydrogenase n=1 Tax=Enhydrobacter aerosaccus TaxID=225324 RepID=A0A1T4TDL8_9HYPH|nr:glycerol-3-phosphate dehydrogenase [Enhydrobacter aerosaccus]SKA38562.1 glycerol-3-phosphate dehydrogenase [Enhydrobacter aerosaccus]